jgi:hypothetical protein
MRLLERALRNNWELPETAYKSVPLAMLQLVMGRIEDGKKILEKPRTRIAAARVLALLHAQNQTADHAAQPPQTHLHEHRHSFEDRRQAYLARLAPTGDGG